MHLLRVKLTVNNLLKQNDVILLLILYDKIVTFNVSISLDVQRFPSLERERERQERERADSGGSSAERRTPARLHDPNHNREVIFALPTMELFFKTEHLQAVTTPESTGIHLANVLKQVSITSHIFILILYTRESSSRGMQFHN